MKAYVKLSLENYSMVKMFSLGFSSVTVTGLPLLCVWLLWLFEDWFVVYGTVTSDRLYNLSEIRDNGYNLSENQNNSLKLTRFWH